MFYRIVVRSELTEHYAGACKGMKMEVGSGQTTFTGQVIDQSYLYGILKNSVSPR